MWTLRKAEAEDAATLVALHTANFPRGWGEAEFLSFYAQGGVIAHLAETETAPIGFVFAWAVAGEVELLSLAVQEDWRRKGVARALSDALINDACALDCKQIHLEVAANNEAAKQLYAALGFAVMHRRKDYYLNADGSRDDAVTMRRLL